MHYCHCRNPSRFKGHEKHDNITVTAHSAYIKACKKQIKYATETAALSSDKTGILLFLVLFEFEAKTKEIPLEKLEKVLELIQNLKDIEKWGELIYVLNRFGKETGIGWCTKFGEKKTCEILIDDYLDY